MESKLLFSDLALNDLEEIVLYISKDSKENAINFYNNLMESVKMLESFPLMGVLVSDKKLSSRKYRMLIIGDYLLFYKTNKEEIRVLRVLHGRRDYPYLFK